MTEDQLLTVIQENPGLQAANIGALAGITKGVLHRRLEVLRANGQIQLIRDHRHAAWWPVNANEPKPYQVERTLNRVREIQSLFNPEISI
jgi:hypothetical protein